MVGVVFNNDACKLVEKTLTLTIFASMECGPMKGLPNGHIPAKGSLLMASSWLEG